MHFHAQMMRCHDNHDMLHPVFPQKCLMYTRLTLSLLEAGSGNELETTTYTMSKFCMFIADHYVIELIIHDIISSISTLYWY